MAWGLETNIKGPAGADSTVPGPQGIQGPAGSTGSQGPQGNPGPAGTTDWNALTNKPATFPPTLPIPESGVTNLVTDLAAKAPLADPTFTGDPKSITPATADNDTSIATTAYVKANLASYPVKTAETRNRVVNGAMQVSQENGDNTSGASGALAFYPADQWLAQTSTSPGTNTVIRVTLPTPNGSKYRIRWGVNVAETTPAASEFGQIVQAIEGVRIVDFQWGTASARQVIVRFGFKGPAGTYSIALRNNAFDRTYVAPFTIAAGQANTDTVQTFIVPGDVTGTWATDTNAGIRLSVALFAGGGGYIGVAGWQAGAAIATSAITNNFATGGNTFELFDVGLYLDPDATGLAPKWQMPDEAQELAACRRYYYRVTGPASTGALRYGMASAVTFDAGTIPFTAAMRVAPATAVITAPGMTNCSAPVVTGTVDSGQITVTVAATSYYGLTTGSGTYAFNSRM